MNAHHTSAHIQDLVAAWRTFFAHADWQKLIANCQPIVNNNGIVYELPNVLGRPNESCAIVDMRTIAYSEPHYHASVEVYFGLSGTVTVYVSGKPNRLAAGDALVITSNKAHFTIPDAHSVFAVVNTPPFSLDDYHVLTESNHAIGFDKKEFMRLTKQAA